MLFRSRLCLLRSCDVSANVSRFAGAERNAGDRSSSSSSRARLMFAARGVMSMPPRTSSPSSGRGGWARRGVAAGFAAEEASGDSLRSELLPAEEAFDSGRPKTAGGVGSASFGGGCGGWTESTLRSESKLGRRMLSAPPLPLALPPLILACRRRGEPRREAGAASGPRRDDALDAIEALRLRWPMLLAVSLPAEEAAKLLPPPDVRCNCRSRSSSSRIVDARSWSCCTQLPLESERLCCCGVSC